MIYTEYFGYTIKCGSIEQAEKLKAYAIGFGLLKTRATVFGQYVQIFLDDHEKHEEARKCWEEYLAIGLSSQSA